MKLHCAHCGKFMADLRDASVRNGMVVLCAQCYKPKQPERFDIPDFLDGFLKGKK